jgi:hypothetical protein
MKRASWMFIPRDYDFFDLKSSFTPYWESGGTMQMFVIIEEGGLGEAGH